MTARYINRHQALALARKAMEGTAIKVAFTPRGNDKYALIVTMEDTAQQEEVRTQLIALAKDGLGELSFPLSPDIIEFRTQQIATYRRI